MHLMPVPGTPAALAQPRRHRAGPGHPTTVPAQPRSRHALPHAEPDPVMWPGRETEAAEGAGGCQRVLGLVVPGTPQMGLGEGGSRRKGLRGKRSRFPLITAKPQPAGRAGGAFRLGLKSTEGHTCDEHARSQHNRTDSAGGGGMWPGGGGHWWDREGGAARGASHPPPSHSSPPRHRWECAGKTESFPRQQAGPGRVWGGQGPRGGSLRPRLLRPGRVLGRGPAVGSPRRCCREREGVPSSPVRDTAALSLPTAPERWGLHPTSPPKCGCTAAPRYLGRGAKRGGCSPPEPQAQPGRGDGPRVPVVAGTCAGRRVGLLPQLFRGWNIPSGAGAARGDAGSWQGPSRAVSPRPGTPGRCHPRSLDLGRMRPPGHPPPRFATHAAPLNIWQIGNKCNIISSVL